jgi:hypothetical protein
MAKDLMAFPDEDISIILELVRRAGFAVFRKITTKSQNLRALVASAAMA